MNQSEIEQAVARATGESRRFINRYGFSLMPDEPDPSPNLALALANRGSRRHQYSTGPAFAHGVAGPNLAYQNALLVGLQNFFESTSFSIFLSRLRSATNCFSFRFSSSSCFIRYASPPTAVGARSSL
jgi:hypothetical protein